MHGGADPVVLIPRHGHGVGVAQIVEVDAVRLPGRPGGDGPDDRDAEAEHADRERHIGGPWRRHEGEDDRPKRGPT
jgi:hypothetical protein